MSIREQIKEYKAIKYMHKEAIKRRETFTWGCTTSYTTEQFDYWNKPVLEAGTMKAKTPKYIKILSWFY